MPISYEPNMWVCKIDLFMSFSSLWPDVVDDVVAAAADGSISVASVVFNPKYNIMIRYKPILLK